MKRFLCLLLAMILVLFTLAGCNNETASTSEDDESETEKEVSEESGDAVKLGMSIKDPSALLSMLMGGEADVDIKDIYVDMTANESSELVYALGAKLFGKSHSVKLFAGKDIILSAPTLLDKSYGISSEAFLAMFSDMMNKVTAPGANSPANVNVQELAEPALRMAEKYSEMLLTELRTNAGLTVHRPAGAKYVQISGKMTTDNLATVFVNFIEELCKDEDFFTILKAVNGMTKEQFLQGKPPKAELLSGLKQELKPLAFEADVNLTVDDEQGITKADIKAGFMIREKAEFELKFDIGAKYFELYLKPAEDSEIRFKFDNGNVLGEFDMTNNYESVQPGFYEEQRRESMNGKLELKDNKLAFDYETKEEYYYKSLSNSFDNTTRESEKIDLEATWSDSGVKFSFTKKDSEYDSSYGKEEENILSAKGEFKISDTGMVMSFEYDDESTQPISIEMRISIGDEIKGTITTNGQKMGEVILEKKVSGSKTTITLKSIDMGGAKLDLADAGISFYINTAAAMPKAPEYTSIENFTEEDFEAIGEKFMKDNAELIEKLSGMFGGMGGATAVPNLPAVNNGAAQEMPGSAWN